MPTNIEVKARLPDLEAIHGVAIGLGARPLATLHQVDTFFAVTHGRLKLRELSEGSGELIYYERSSETGPKPSVYSIYPTSAPKRLGAVLAAAFGLRGVVDKRRQVLLLGQTRIHLDEVLGLGAFLELEVVLSGDQSPLDGERIAGEILGRLEIPQAALVPGAYIDLLEQVNGRADRLQKSG